MVHERMNAIGAMPLYATIARVRNELEQVALSATLSPEQVYPFDQIHYRGVEAVRDAAAALALKPGEQVLDVGSGIGGPARFLARTVGCRVTALELQDEMHAVGQDLTDRCGLSDLVSHVQGDALTYPLRDGSYDAVVTWLAVHHIPERSRLMRRLASGLRAGGRLYLEDLCEHAPFADDDLTDVRETLHGVTMTTATEYVQDVRSAGFTVIEATDLREEWSRFCAARAASWRAAADRHRRVHGAEIFASLDRFFTTVQRLFESGSLGGLRIVASANGNR
jgi:cyclopropane fatty-acyl-phospholipid synthase-like methyltransferase